MGDTPKRRQWSVLMAAALWVGLAVVSSGAVGLGDLAGQVSLPQKEEKAEPKQGKDAKPVVQAYTGPKKRIGVMDMEVKITATSAAEPTTTGGLVQTTTVNIPPPSDFGSGLTEMLTTALVESGRFIVLERKALTDIQTELALGASGAVDPTAAAPGGKLLGAQALIRGAVTEFTYRRSSTSGAASFLKGIGVGSSQAEAAVVLDIRLYDVATSQIIDSVKAEGRAKSSAAALDIDKEDLKMSASTFNQTPLGHATRQAIERAVALIIKRMEQIPWEGRIAELDADEGGSACTLYINAGSSAGLKQGDRFEVLRPGRPITDPETKVVIGRTKDKRLGCCRIESLTKNLAMATPTEGEGFQIADVVKLIEVKPKPPAPAPAPVPTQGQTPPPS